MPILFACGNCGKKIKAPDTAAGKKTKCPDCGEVVVVPSQVRRAAPPVEEEEEDRPAPSRTKSYEFDFVGGAGTYFVTGLLAYLLTGCTCGIGFPWAICMVLRWTVENSRVKGSKLRFVGTGGELFGLWIKWFLLFIVTAGIYSFWIVPSLNRWIARHTEFARE